MDSESVAALANGVEDQYFPLKSQAPRARAPPFKQPFVIGVAGGTASGKTTVCNMIISQMNHESVVLVNQDSFYHSLSDEKLQKVHEYNFDHPDAFNTELLLSCMEQLKLGQEVSIPDYDFKSHRSTEAACKIRGMHTLVRDVRTRKHDFVFYADRLIRLVVEHGLGHLPFSEKQITTPTGSVYTGVVFRKRLCGVSIIRSGESMENALRACCKGIKIGKILIHGEGNSGRQLIYEKLPADISSRHVFLLDPVLASGNSAVKAITLLLSKGVPENNIIFLNLIAAPEGIHAVCKRFPKMKLVTSEIDASLDENARVIPGMGEFGDRYFGTD